MNDATTSPQSVSQYWAAIGGRPGVVQVAVPRPSEMVTNPLATPTGPGQANGFRNCGGSQIALPQVTNVYLGAFWGGDRTFFEGFSQAVVERGYLAPLSTLGYGTGPGRYLGTVDAAGPASGTVVTDADTQGLIAGMLDAGTLAATASSLFMLLLPLGVISQMGGPDEQSCTQYCGYHDAFDHNGNTIAYAVLPSPSGCAGCGNGDIGAFTAVYAHELAEACTDKVPGQGWMSDDGWENADLEAWILRSWGPPEQPDRYTVQGYYTNEQGNTIGAW
jgi:hypothetical protein